MKVFKWKKIIRNVIRCKNCGDIIESKYTHDYVTCKCGRCSVDGGPSYLRRSFSYSTDDYEELSEFDDENEKIDDKKSEDWVVFTFFSKMY